MSEYNFTLLIEDATEVTEQIENSVFEAGCDDALLFSRDGRVYLDFAREAPNRAEAVASALRDVATAGFRAKLAGEAETAA
jgi:hypothetical protein